MPSDAQNRGGFPDAKDAYDRTYQRFGTDYEGRIAAALKGSWDRDNEDITAIGYPKDPSDAQFGKWAKELIQNRQITYADPDHPDKKIPPISLQTIQGKLEDGVKRDLRKTFGTDDLNYIILDKEQFPTAGQQLAQASFNQLSGGAKWLNIIMGALDWLFDKLQGGNMGFQEAIARRTTQSMAENADKMLAQNAPSVHPGMRRYLVQQYKNAADQEAGLIAPAPQVRLEDVAIGSNRSKPTNNEASGPSADSPAPGAGAGAAANAAPNAAAAAPQTDLTGTPEQRVTRVISGISDQIMAGLRGNSNDPKAAEKAAAAEALKPDMIAIGTKVLMDNKPLLEEGNAQALAGAYADALMNDTATKNKLQAALKDAGLDYEGNPDGMKDYITHKMQKQIEANLEQLQTAVDGKTTPAPAPAAGASAGSAPKPGTSTPTPAPVPTDAAEDVAEAVSLMTTKKTKEFVVAEAVKGYNDSYVGYGYGTIKNELKLINRLDGKPLSEADRTALDAAKNKVYKFAIDSGYAPNAHEGGQQSVISKAVGEAVAETISDPEYRGLTKEDLAKRIEIAVENKLYEYHGEINKRGRPIEEINQKAGLNVFASIAKQVSAEVLNADGKTYGQLVEAQNRITQAQLAGIDRSGLTNLAVHTTPGAVVSGEQGGPRYTSSPAPVPRTEPGLGG